MKLKYVMIGLILSAHITVAQSLYSDVKARKVGDVLSVLVIESADASRESQNKSAQSSDMKLGAKATGNVAAFLPLFGASSNLSTSSKGGDGTSQKDKLRGRITVRITEITENGTYKIQGERILNVNGEENVMSLEGYVRPRDISTSNTVYSYNVADAEIIYKKGGITNLIDDGFFGSAITKLVGLGMVAAALGYLSLK